jgi:repressor LexA
MSASNEAEGGFETVKQEEQDGPTGWQRQRIVRFVRQFTEREGYPPTLREIGAAVDLAPSSVHYHLSVLQDGGHLTRGAGRPRTAVPRRQPTAQPTVGGHLTRGAARLRTAAVRRQPIAEPTDGDNVQVPLVGRIAGGVPILAEEMIEDTIWLPRRLVGAGTVFLLKVTGDSMTGVGINDGDFVVVREQQSAVSGEIVAAAVPSLGGSEAEATVKTLQCVSGHVWLIPQNPAHAPIPADDITIYGKVVAVLRGQL